MNPPPCDRSAALALQEYHSASSSEILVQPNVRYERQLGLADNCLLDERVGHHRHMYVRASQSKQAAEALTAAMNKMGHLKQVAHSIYK